MGQYKCLGVFLYMSERKVERKIDWLIGPVSAVVQWLYSFVVVMKELRQKSELLIYRSIYVSTLIYGHELCIDQKNKIADANSQNEFPL